MFAALIVGHGSRSFEAQEDFNKMIKLVSEFNNELIIQGAHMELANPNVEEGVENILKLNPNIKEIKIIPYFLYNGIHIKEDIPNIILELEKKYPQISFKFGKPLGATREISELLYKKVMEL